MSTRKPSPSMVVALVALSIAAGGTAAATTLITGHQIKDGSITTADIRNRTIRLADLSPGAIASLKATARATVPTGATGLQLSVVKGTEVLVAPRTVGTATATCAAGQSVLGGGFYGSSDRSVDQG